MTYLWGEVTVSNITSQCYVHVGDVLGSLLHIIVRFFIYEVPAYTRVIFTSRKKPVPFNIPIRNVELMQDCFLKYLCMETARMK